LEKPALVNLGYTVQVADGPIKINAAAYADYLILYTETQEGMEALIRHLEAFCKYAKMKVNADKCVSLSQIWLPAQRAQDDMNPFWIKGAKGYEQVPMEMVSVYLGMPIGFNRYENSKHGQEVLASTLEDARIIGRSKLRITQKMHALKMFVFLRIDYRMMCADLSRTHLDKWDTNIRGMVGE
jgi:hypothetical protein